MGLDIIIPVVAIAILVPVAIAWAKQRFKDNVHASDADAFVAPSDRLTSNALRDFETPPWRVVYEIAHDKMSGVGHVLIGTSGVYALKTTMDPLPAMPATEPDAKEIGAAAIVRFDLDDALRRCAMSSERLVMVHWGPNEGSEIAVDLMPGVTAVDGREIVTWANGTAGDVLTASQVDLAWQTVVTAIGRPNPLA